MRMAKEEGDTTIHFHPEDNDSSLISLPAFRLPAENGNQGYCWPPMLPVLKHWWRLKSPLNSINHNHPSAQRQK